MAAFDSTACSALTRRRLLGGVAALGFASLVAGCSEPPAPGNLGATGSSGAPAGGKELAQIVLATKMSELEDLNPLSARGSRGIAVSNHVNEGLTKFAPDFSVVPGLATDWKVSDDVLTYTFTLRQNVQWHDGTALTAADVIFSFDTAMAANSKATSKTALTTYVASVKPTANDIVITLKKPYPPILSVLAGQVPILPKAVLANDAYAASFSAIPVGTGPYKITKRDTTTLTLEAFGAYWGTKPKIAKIVLFDSPDPSAQYAGFLTNQIDVVEYDPNAMTGLESKGAKVWTGAAGSVHGICLDLSVPQIAQKEVRQALRLALDRQRIMAAGYVNGTLADVLVPTAFKGFHADLPEVKRDVAAAADLLDKAGWAKGTGGMRAKDGQPLKFTLNAWPAKQWQDMVTVAQANWKEIGVDVTLTTVENARIAEVLSGSFGAAPIGWGLTASPVVGMNLLLHSTTSTFKQGGTFNVFHYSNPAVDKALEDALATANIDKQEKLLKSVQQAAYDDVPFIPIAYPAYQLGARDGVVLNETGKASATGKGGLSGVGEAWFMDRWSGA